MSASERGNSVTRMFKRFSARLSRRRETERRLGAGATTSPWEGFGNRAAVVLLVGTFVISLFHVMARGKKATGAGTKEVLTLAHWQLEPGVRTGFEWGAVKYNEMRRAKNLPEMEFKQLPITEKGYGQWVTTQLMGGTAPDLIEMGLGLPWSIWVNYRARYFVPVTQEIMKPNPYNEGCFFEVQGKMAPGKDVPWKETYIDSMGQGIWELQEYYDIGLSTFSQRLFYNPILLKELTGRLAQEGKWPAAIEVPPDDLRKFLELCDKIAELKNKQGAPYYPIAGSAYQLNVMFGQMINPLTVVLMDVVDENRDAYAANDETLFAYLRGSFKFDDPRLLKVMGLSHELCRRYQKGWNGLNRDDAVMLFIQWRSVFICTGSWDGMTLKEQAAGAVPPFPVEIAQFPMPVPSDPEWGDIAFGRNYEKPGMGFSFGLTKTSKHQELALDFLRFLSAQKANEEFNKVIGWIPAVKGAKPSEFLAAFAPNYDGVSPGWNLSMGGRSQTVMDQVNPLLFLGEDEKGKPFSVKDWARRMTDEWPKAAVQDFEQRDEVERDALRSKESTAALMRAKMILYAGTEQGDYYRRRYLGYLGEPLDSPRRIARWQAQLRDAREQGLLPK
ncbi:MAG: extracellular solute-binding protein [Planctomycetota bacterium]|nr:extracellular solute-binding protein [Planctomycetota bacterium]